jgi:hypothetical protein
VKECALPRLRSNTIKGLQGAFVRTGAARLGFHPAPCNDTAPQRPIETEENALTLPLSRAGIAALLALAAAPSAFAQPAPTAIGRSETLTAIVETVDLTTREVLLRREDGELARLIASPEVRNLRQVRPGDIVAVTFKQALAVAVTAPGDTRPARWCGCGSASMPRPGPATA